MERDVALRIDGFIWAVRDSLASITAYMKRNLSKKEYDKYISLIGTCLAKTVQISNGLYEIFPDIVPEEFRDDSPAPYDSVQTAHARRSKASGKARKRR
jgi:hypothetical protein